MLNDTEIPEINYLNELTFFCNALLDPVRQFFILGVLHLCIYVKQDFNVHLKNYSYLLLE